MIRTHQIATAWDVASQYLPSLYGGWKHRDLFTHVERYCMFLGYPRSGHTLIGALLDAHPNVVIAHELDTLRYLYAGYSKYQLYYLLLEKARRFAARGCKTTRYTYNVSQQFQGTSEAIRVIGDKHGESTTLRLRACPWLFEHVKNIVGIPIKYIHVIRNPFDNIGSMCRRGDLPLHDGIEYYFSLCETVDTIRTHIHPDDLFELRHESFIDAPGSSLQQLCQFLDIEVSDAYVADCTAIVYPSPTPSRTHTQWTSDAIAQVQERLAMFSFLSGYAYEPHG